MIQNVTAPLTLFPEVSPTTGDYVFQCKGSSVALTPWNRAATTVHPLVRIGECSIFLGAAPNATWGNTQLLRRLPTAELRFGAFCANHLARWLLNHRWCGRCGTLLQRRKAALTCPACNHEVYPTLSPAVIVGIVHQGKLLVTRYADRPYTGPALVAGYCEVGETAEATCIREAYEETGLHITNIRYFASQPWGLSGALLLGYFAEATHADIHLQDGELSEAMWLSPDAVPPPPDACGTLSLTATMIQAFAKGQVTF
ncbi:MAG: NUDIX domain-containing protein [Kiritimatiellae bacterium]|nr:NUDIX domain-containing protein [Kiritimatiellia bacterium]